MCTDEGEKSNDGYSDTIILLLWPAPSLTRIRLETIKRRSAAIVRGGEPGPGSSCFSGMSYFRERDRGSDRNGFLLFFFCSSFFVIVQIYLVLRRGYQKGLPGKTYVLLSHYIAIPLHLHPIFTISLFAYPS